MAKGKETKKIVAPKREVASGTRENRKKQAESVIAHLRELKVPDNEMRAVLSSAYNLSPKKNNMTLSIMPTIAWIFPEILGFFFTLTKPAIPKIKPEIVEPRIKIKINKMSKSEFLSGKKEFKKEIKII